MTRAGFKDAFGKVGKYQTFKDGMQRAAARLTSRFTSGDSVTKASTGATYKSLLRLVEMYDYCKSEVDTSGQKEVLRSMMELLSKPESALWRGADEAMAVIKKEFNTVTLLQGPAPSKVREELSDMPSGKRMALGSIRDTRATPPGNFAKDGLQARQGFQTFLENGGRNVMGSVQQSPVRSDGVGDQMVTGRTREAIFRERLAQSGTTQEEHASLGSHQSRREGIGGPDARVALSEGEKSRWQRTIGNEGVEAHHRNFERFKLPTSAGGAGGTWAGAKKVARSGTEADVQVLKSARRERQDFLDKTLKQTAVKFFEDTLTSMMPGGRLTDPLKITEIYADPGIKPGDSPETQAAKKAKKDEEYLDGRFRRFQLKLPDNLAGQYGPTLTVRFDAPGSTQDTSDIDMQFIVEESPASCSQLIKTFQEQAKTNLEKLEMGEKSVAEVFDMNPYPAGFAFRSEISSDLQFADSYSAASLNQKRVADAGLAMLRRLDAALDPDATIKKMMRGLTGPGETRMQQSISIGVEVSLKAQLGRASALLENPKFDEGSQRLVDLVRRAEGWSDINAWKSTPPPSVESMVDKLTLSQEIADELSRIASKSPANKKMVTEARNTAYLRSLKEVEVLTVARDKSVVVLGNDLLDAERRLHENPDDATAREKHQSTAQSMRELTAEFGTQGFIALGIALHHADEAYSTRGAVGHVVEMQMGRRLASTPSTGISNIESNYGFILEHLEHDTHGHDLAHVKGNDLADFAISVAKYVGRIAKSVSVIDISLDVSPPLRDSEPPTGSILIGSRTRNTELGKFYDLGVALDKIKGGDDPMQKGRKLTTTAEKQEATLAALREVGITNLQQLADLVGGVVSQSWTTYQEKVPQLTEY